MVVDGDLTIPGCGAQGLKGQPAIPIANQEVHVVSSPPIARICVPTSRKVVSAVVEKANLHGHVKP